MSILDKLARSAVREAIRAPRLERYASEHMEIDEWVLDDAKGTSPVLREAIERPLTVGEKTYEPAEHLRDDIFMAAHTAGDSRVKAPDRVRGSHQLNHTLLKELVRTEAHRDAKVHTEGDKLGSSLYSRAAYDEWDKVLAERLKDQAQQAQERHEAEERLEQVKQDLADARERAKGAHDAGQPIPSELAQEVKDLVAQREQAGEQVVQTPVPDARGEHTAIVNAAERAAEKGRDLAQAWSTLAGLGAGSLDYATPDEAWALAQSWMALPDFRELIQLIGRVVRDFRAEVAKQVIGGSDEVVGVEAGADLSRVLPTELARLGDPLRRTSFYMDFVEETLLQFQTQGREKVSLGPGVLLLDISSSMSSGRRLLEAKATVIGFVRTMHAKKRDAVVICFTTRVLWEHHFKRGEPLHMGKLLELACVTPTGGTHIATAFRRAEHYINRSKPFKRADVVVVTDGEDTSSATDVRDRFQAAGVRTLGISIGSEPKPRGWLLTHCDAAIGVNQLTDATGDLVRAVS